MEEPQAPVCVDAAKNRNRQFRPGSIKTLVLTATGGRGRSEKRVELSLRGPSSATKRVEVEVFADLLRDMKNEANDN